MSLALATVIYEWRRYMAAVIALAFSGLLVLAQVGMFVGMGKAFTATIDRSRADIFVLGPNATSLFGGGGGLPRRIKPLVYLDPEVVEAAELAENGGMFGNLPGPNAKPTERKREYVVVWGVDPIPGAVSLPTDFSEQVRQALLEPYTIVVDKSALARLGVKVGDSATLNGRTVKIGALLDTYPSLMQVTLVASRSTMRLMNMINDGTRIGPLMVRLRDPSRAEIVRNHLNAISKGQFRAWTRQELAIENGKAMMKNQVIGIMLGFSMFLGLLIGIGITSQTLRGAILANIKELASLRALGVSMGSLRRIVIEMSFWVGVAGLGMTAILVFLVSLLAKSGGVPMSFPTSNIISTGVFLLIIALGSGVLSLGILKKSQPADLLR